MWMTNFLGLVIITFLSKNLKCVYIYIYCSATFTAEHPFHNGIRATSWRRRGADFPTEPRGTRQVLLGANRSLRCSHGPGSTKHHYSLCVYICVCVWVGARSIVVVKALCYKPEGRGLDSR
jgi:hypothetical protein